MICAIGTEVDGVRKVIESLSAEIGHRLSTDAFGGLPVVVEASGNAGQGSEPMLAELQELVLDTPESPLTPLEGK